MEFKEKIKLMDAFLQKIGNRLMGVPSVLDDNHIPKEENIEKYRIIENELIRNNLVLVKIKPNTNKTAGGWGVFRISPKGLELVESKKSVATLFPEESRMNLIFDLLQIISDKSQNGISIYELADIACEEMYKIRKLIDYLSVSDFVKTRDASTKDRPKDCYITLTDRGQYAKISIENLKEEMTDILDLKDYTFFEHSEVIPQSSSQQSLDLRGALVEKIVMGDDKSKTITVRAKNEATVQIAESGGENKQEGRDALPFNFWEYFRVRKLMGWTVGALSAAVLTYFITPSIVWTGLIFAVIIGWGFYTALTSDGKYIRYSKWVLMFGMGAAGILNGLPVIAGEVFGQVGIGHNIIHFFGQWTIDEQPLITIAILLLTFGLSSYLVYKDIGRD